MNTLDFSFDNALRHTIFIAVGVVLVYKFVVVVEGFLSGSVFKPFLLVLTDNVKLFVGFFQIIIFISKNFKILPFL